MNLTSQYSMFPRLNGHHWFTSIWVWNSLRVWNIHTDHQGWLPSKYTTSSHAFRSTKYTSTYERDVNIMFDRLRFLMNGYVMVVLGNYHGRNMSFQSISMVMLRWMGGKTHRLSWRCHMINQFQDTTTRQLTPSGCGQPSLLIVLISLTVS